MAINKNHEFEELDGVKCGIVEKNVPADRVQFLKELLEFNKFTVMVVPSPAQKLRRPKLRFRKLKDQFRKLQLLLQHQQHSRWVLLIIHLIP